MTQKEIENLSDNELIICLKELENFLKSLENEVKNA